MDGTPPYLPGDDDRDDLAALDFSVDDYGEGSTFDAFEGYVRTQPSDDEETFDSIAGFAAESGDEQEPSPPLFTVTNPPGTVSVSAYLDGRVHRIDLSARVTNMTEPQLAEEILLIAGLARQKARSAQYTFMLDGMRELGHDNVATRDFLSRDLGLPSPEEATAKTAQLFATRYSGDHD
ncbi:secretion protein EspD [Mycobacterium shimoidei]|uniref:ESX-1 secretion-associated protein EspH n=1 Tax=Mycobacterium shimoidei TaxID=29313 RepID=A0A1E3TLE5_MYCSH|nr:secretion protein EspD [Mycobacterium shimoidei]ODR15278.1 secretion protein EspD [Mycobacterium shimoidei]ORW79861.1 secretion protein EspD [Mycobacterium shimoidei]SRX92884.1 ESX-1 secretion-associated protein EspH [Mycobacterium shimoidei]